jgi:hypothetical protein
MASPTRLAGVFAPEGMLVTLRSMLRRDVVLASVALSFDTQQEVASCAG